MRAEGITFGWGGCLGERGKLGGVRRTICKVGSEPQDGLLHLTSTKCIEFRAPKNQEDLRSGHRAHVSLPCSTLSSPLV